LRNYDNVHYDEHKNCFISKKYLDKLV
jgi:hypothetical protein